MLVITPRRKLPNFRFPREAVGRKNHAFFDTEKAEMGQSNISVHTRESSSGQKYPTCNSVSLLLGGFRLPGITFPISLFFRYLKSDSQHHGTPFPPGCMSPLLGSPDILAGELSWTCSLFPYRNFLFPCSKRFLWKCSCSQSFHVQSNVYLSWWQWSFLHSSTSECPVSCRKPETGSCIQHSCLIFSLFFPLF